ncbi:MAG: FHA domain-containing protein [Candidatus Acidiferrales bacterium]
MAKLVLKFEGSLLQEVPINAQPITIGRAPENVIPIDNLAVSNHHARIFTENGHLVIEDLNSLNGTFVNDQRIKRSALKDGDVVLVGKHHIVVDQWRNVEFGHSNFGPKVATPAVDETFVLDTKKRREMIQEVAAAGERSQIAPERVRVATLAVLSGKTDQKEYLLSSRLTVIGKSKMATVRLGGWFKPNVAAQINRKDDGYYLGRGDHVPKVNGQPVTSPVRLSEGDVIEVAGVQLAFQFRE